MRLSAAGTAWLPSRETWRTSVRAAAAAAGLSLALALGGAVSASGLPSAAAHGAPVAQSQPAHDAPVSEGSATEAHAGEGEHGESIWATAGKLFNFAVLAGVLVYFLRPPLRQYLANRGQQIRNDLVTAAAMKEDAARQIARVDAKLKELPAELDALRERGQREIAAEQARIEQAAAAERDRLLEQTRRAIDLQVRVARRDLATHAADLAVQVARQRIEAHITDEDQRRLLERYLERVEAHE